MVTECRSNEHSPRPSGSLEGNSYPAYQSEAKRDEPQLAEVGNHLQALKFSDAFPVLAAW